MIENYSFGKMVISGKSFSSDLLIIDGEVLPKWWRKSGHSVSVEDAGAVFAAKPQCLVLGTGKPGLMRADKKLRERLQDEGIDLIEEPTAKAVITFNQLVENSQNVAAGFHLTC